MEKTFTEKEVIDIISLVEAIKDGKKIETPNGKGGYVEVKDIIVNDLLQHFKKYRISSNTSLSKYKLDLTDDEIDMIETSVRCMLSAKMNDKAQKICRNILDGLKEIKPNKNIKTLIKEVKEAINASPCYDCIDTSDNDEIDCSKCPFNDELTNEELLSRIAENNSNNKK